MIEIMDKINNHFIKSIECINCTFTSGTTSTMEFDIDKIYLKGMYIVVKGSYLNDGIYKISDVTGNVISVEEELLDEDLDKKVYIIASTPPKAFVDLSQRINSFKSSNNGGIKSKSTQDLEITYADDNSWTTAFRSDLNKYKNIFDDIQHFWSNYNYV